MLAEWEDDILNQTREKDLTRRSYDAMLSRPKHAKTYEKVDVCSQWRGEQGFETFVKDMGLRRHGGLSLERLNPFVGYFPENCTWADRHTQDRNKTNSVRYNVEGQLMNLVDLALRIGSTSRKTSQKIGRMTRNGFTPDEAAERILADCRAAYCAVS